MCTGTSAVSWEVQQQDVGAEAAQVVQRLQVLLEFPIGQFTPEDGCQVTKHIGIQRRRSEQQQISGESTKNRQVQHTTLRMNSRVPEEELL